jgi:NhaC family Na+:H+ antiporter
VTGTLTEHESTRAPSFLDALAPVVVLIVLLALTIILFGVDAANGPLQVALFTSATFAGLVALKNGYTSARLRDAVVGGVSSAMGAISSCSPSER